MHKLGYFAFLFGVFLFRITPFWLLYLIADFFTFLNFYLIRYRKQVVYNNLRLAFPEKDNAEINQLAKAFFRNLADILLEGIKGFSMTEQQATERYRVLNPQLTDAFFAKNQNMIALAAHYANWEWGAISMCFQMKHTLVGLYKPLTNKYIDDYMDRIRTKMGSEVISIYSKERHFKHDQPKPSILVMVADQSALNTRRAYWMDFFGQDTGFLHGPERFSKMYDVPLVYFDVKRVKRGYYTVEISLLVEHPKTEPNGEITRKYKDKLEGIIRAKPEDWLWSHRRWKRKRPEGM